MNKQHLETSVFTTPLEKLKQIFRQARDLSWEHHGQQLEAYYPKPKFPSISITGEKCEQNCLYCNKKYLKGMKAITNPSKLLEFAIELEQKDGKGFLLSGGYDSESKVPLDPFLETINKIKKQTDLQINAHVGLVTLDEAKQIKKAGIDTVSFDFVTDNEVIREIIRNGKTGEDYVKAYKSLCSANLKVIPHICLGLYYGTNKGNLDAIKKILSFSPEMIVLLGLIPTKGTPMENSPTIPPGYFARVMLYIRLIAPSIIQSLGCMRVRSMQLEKYAIDSGVNHIAVPKSKTLKYAKEKYALEITKHNTCCSF